MKRNLMLVVLVLTMLVVSLGVFGLGGAGGADYSESGESSENQPCISQKCKQIDEVWLGIGKILGIDKAKEEKVWDYIKGWASLSEVYTPSLPTSPCSKAPIDPDIVKTSSNSLHTKPGSGHGWAKCGSPYCAVDLRPGNTCQEASSNTRSGIFIKSPISGVVTSQFDLPNDYGRVGSCIVITDSSSDSKAVLCHVDSMVRTGDRVNAGSIVGKLTGWSCGTGIFGPHLHFELRLNGRWISGDGFIGTWKNQLKALGCTTS
jgi:hypothetical protein